MKYMGSKSRIVKHILPIMLERATREGLTRWVEPFVGGGNVICKIPANFDRTGYDLNPHTIAALIGVRDYVEQLPDNVTEHYYRSIKGTDPHPINSWIRFECSFAAILDNGFARNSEGRNYAEKGKNLAVKQSPLLEGVQLLHSDYRDLNFDNSVIYCDPPYQNTRGYLKGGFNHVEFFNWCREQSKNNLVFISEYSAPDDFETIWEKGLKTTFASQRSEATHHNIEKLFLVP